MSTPRAELRTAARRKHVVAANMLLFLLNVGCAEDAAGPSRSAADASADGALDSSQRDAGLDAPDAARPLDADAAASLDAASLDGDLEAADSSDEPSDAAVPNDGVPESESASDGAFDDVATTDAGNEAAADDAAPSTACSVYCACMAPTCASYLGYPYADEASCFLACRAFSLEESVCFRGFCISAEREPIPAMREHSCQHAWGAYGLLEC